MRRGVLVCVLLLPLFALRAQTLPPANLPLGQNASADYELLRRLEADYLRAEIEDDATIAASILADDYVGLRPDGSSTNKSEVLNRLDQHLRRRDPYLITATNMQEHLFGDSACVTLVKIYARPGAQAAYRETVLHLFTRKGANWHLQLSSPLPSPARVQR